MLKVIFTKDRNTGYASQFKKRIFYFSLVFCVKAAGRTTVVMITSFLLVQPE
jgi:hypothetical protein